MSLKQSIILAVFLLICNIALGQKFNCIENTCIPKTDTLDGQKIFQKVDKMPEYPGGMEAMFKFIGQNIKFQGSGDVRGKMLITFIVDTTGHIRN